MPNIIDNEELYLSIVLGGKNSPGRVTLSGHDRVAKWDVQTGPFMLGGRTILTGIPPIEFSASFYLVKDPAQGLNDFDLWDDFQKLIDSTIAGVTSSSLVGGPGKQPKALDIYHPDLARNYITSVCKASVGGFVYDDKGGATVVVKFQEYRPMRRIGGATLGSNKDANDPNADLKKQGADLTAQYQKTPWG
jgi:hypothetical protein